MESSTKEFNPSTTRDDRVAIKTALLFNIPYKDIQKKLNVTRGQILYARN